MEVLLFPKDVDLTSAVGKNMPINSSRSNFISYEMIKATKMRAGCLKQGDWLFLQTHYGHNYMGQIMIKKPEKDIPKIIKALEKGLKKFKRNMVE